MNTKIKKGDLVVVIAGKDRGKQAKVARVLTGAGKVIVEGANLQKKRQRPQKQGQKGQVLSLPAPMDLSNVQLWCVSCARGVRISTKVGAKKNLRLCHRCKREI